MRLSQIVAEVTGKPIGAAQQFAVFEVMCTNDAGDDVDLPCVRVALR